MKNQILLLLWVLILMGGNCAYGAEPLKINTSLKPPFSTQEQDGFFDLLVRELFGRLDIVVEFVRLPSERALNLANEGVSDGEVPRIAGLTARYPDLIQVPEPIIDYNFVAFMREPACMDIFWGKLEGMAVGLMIGWKIYENNVPAGADQTRVRSPVQLFDLLKAGRVEIVLYERYAGRHFIAVNDLPLEECQPPLAVRPMYLYMNRKHEALVESLSQELIKMKKDGSWQEISAKTLKN